MKEVNVNRKFFDNYTFDYALSAESNRYYNDNEYLKVIHRRLLKDDRENIVRGLHYFNQDNIVTPNYLLKERNKFIGYAMNYLKGYKDLSIHLEDNITFEERKKLMLTLSKVFDYFDEMKFAYHDLHSNNIMYKDGDIKLIDLDGGVLYPYRNDGFDYLTAARIAKKTLARYTLATMFGMSMYDIIKLKNYKNRKYYKSFMDNLPDNVKELFEYAINEEYYMLFGITDRIKNVTQTMSDYTNDIIERKHSKY